MKGKILHCLRAHYPADRQNLVLFELESSLCFCRVSMKSVEAVKKKQGKYFSGFKLIGERD